MTDHLEMLKRNLRDALPKRIGEAVTRYDDFVLQEPGETPKDFAAHQAACKSALAHIELLVKLLRWAADEDRQENGDEDALSEADLVQRARLALSQDEAADEEDQP